MAMEARHEADGDEVDPTIEQEAVRGKRRQGKIPPCSQVGPLAVRQTGTQVRRHVVGGLEGSLPSVQLRIGEVDVPNLQPCLLPRWEGPSCHPSPCPGGSKRLSDPRHIQSNHPIATSNPTKPHEIVRYRPIMALVHHILPTVRGSEGDRSPKVAARR